MATIRQNRHAAIRNREWYHMINDHVISMPDKWEYPWFAAWDLAFHTMALAVVDIDFAKQQIDLLLQGNYLHPTGQIPAYEWNFGDVNPPVHAWAAIFLYRMEQAMGHTDLAFLNRAFTKLSLNFTWWVNRKDRFGKNVFEGGFLGLDNIGVFDRSAPLPTGGHLEQADGTAWMALYCQNMLEIAVELAARDPTYEEMATKFGEQFLWIARAMNSTGPDGMWDEEDGFYYDVLRVPDGSASASRCALSSACCRCAPSRSSNRTSGRSYPTSWPRSPNGDAGCRTSSTAFMRRGPATRRGRARHHGDGQPGPAAPDPDAHARRKGVLQPAWHPRAVAPPRRSSFRVLDPGQEYRVEYLPAESDSGMFGGNSNWRGPVWMPINALLIRALLQYYLYYGDKFKIECPTGSGVLMNLFEVAHEIGDRLIGIFLRDETRPAAGVRRNREVPDRSALAGLPAVPRIFPW